MTPRLILFAAAALAATPAVAQDTTDQPAAASATTTVVVSSAPAQSTGPIETTAPQGDGLTMDSDHPLCADKGGQRFAEPGPLDPAKGRVVFFRKGSLMGAPYSFRVREGETEFCTLSNGSYFIIDMAPGTHAFDAHTTGDDNLPVEVEPGETAYVQVRMALGAITYVPNLLAGNAADFDKAKAKLHYSHY